MSKILRHKYQTLVTTLKQNKRILVAFSGGCDSAFLLAAAQKSLGRDNVLAVTAISASLPVREREETRVLAENLDADHEYVETDELNNPSYSSNPSNRCFFCKDELFGKLSGLAQSKAMILADGFNLSDRADYRPGFKASQKWKVIHPLDEANLTKSDIRILSRWMGLPTWNKPASPCLSSRIPYGTPVTEMTLKRIERAEEVLRDEGFRVCRVRHFDAQARIEVELTELPRLQERVRWNRIVARLHEVGYLEVVADPRGFKSGRLNDFSSRAYEETS